MTTSFRKRSIFKWLTVTLFLTLAPSLAYAHIGVGVAAGLAHGMLHPFTGLDHLFTMIAVGLWAKQIGGRAVYLVPASFVSVMMLGGALGINGIYLPFIENGILLSLLVLGVLIAGAIRLPLMASMTIVAVFALFHGYAHGAEMPHNTSGLNYALGFVLSTCLLHAVGIRMATWTAKASRPEWLRLAGAAIALLGGTLFFATYA